MAKLLALPPVAVLAASVVAACASAPPAPLDEPPPLPPAPTTDAVQPVAATGAATPSASAPAPSAAPIASAPTEPEGPSACPTGMVLVEGEYCTKVEHQCLVEWYAPQNNKRVCEKFAEKAKCVGERVKKRYCIDKFSWPNKQGVRPEVMNTFYQAQVKCAAAGKRMCTESEWTMACEGPDMKPFPYGFVRDPKKCNGDHQWDGPNMKKVAKRDAKELARLWRGVPSGSQPDCVSDYGVHDLPGNNDEVVAGESPKAKFASVNTGGPWYSGVRNQCRPKIYTHEEGFYYYFLGFRCCSAPDGAPNEPRTPSQVKDGTKWETVERLAGFGVDTMKKALAQKEKGACTCKNRELEGVGRIKGQSWMCDTICGTLLGPDAKDGDDSTRVPHEKRRDLD
ncbi:MAG: SUMF1/EgtB/PvdO family nonheme iron enzyme [Myxococcales bacterium]|nr:SUMF1/EgtB/PvdO family nonheme iron enzyme [Myxococcales bacterium]